MLGRQARSPGIPHCSRLQITGTPYLNERRDLFTTGEDAATYRIKVIKRHVVPLDYAADDGDEPGGEYAIPLGNGAIQFLLRERDLKRRMKIDFILEWSEGTVRSPEKFRDKARH